MENHRRRVRSAVITGLGAARQRRSRNGDPVQLSPKVVEVEITEDLQPVLGLLRSMPRQVDSMRMDEYLHVSDVISKCIRKRALLDGVKSLPMQTIADGQAITFAIGDSLHNFVKRRFTYGHPDSIYGKWQCQCKETTTDASIFSRRKEKVCPKCDGPTDNYVELVMKDKDAPVTGSMDLVLWLSEYQAFLITEIKSKSGALFKELVRPDPDHRVQVSWYWRMLKDSGLPVVDFASILYVNKEYSFKSPYLEFILPQPQEKLLKPYLEDAMTFQVFRDTGKYPPRIICGTIDAPEAKKCPVAVQCFSTKGKEQ